MRTAQSNKLEREREISMHFFQARMKFIWKAQQETLSFCLQQFR